MTLVIGRKGGAEKRGKRRKRTVMCEGEYLCPVSLKVINFSVIHNHYMVGTMLGTGDTKINRGLPWWRSG